MNPICVAQYDCPSLIWNACLRFRVPSFPTEEGPQIVACAGQTDMRENQKNKIPKKSEKKTLRSMRRRRCHPLTLLNGKVHVLLALRETNDLVMPLQFGIHLKQQLQPEITRFQRIR